MYGDPYAQLLWIWQTSTCTRGGMIAPMPVISPFGWTLDRVKRFLIVLSATLASGTCWIRRREDGFPRAQ